MEPEPPGAAFFAWSRSRRSGTLAIRSRSRPKKWRLRNTADKHKNRKTKITPPTSVVEPELPEPSILTEPEKRLLRLQFQSTDILYGNTYLFFIQSLRNRVIN